MFDKIEPEARAFLKKIMLTMSIFLTWMFINVVAGLAYECALIEGKLTLTNIIFYTWLLISLVFIIIWFVKLWGKK
jgi:hypothetical protein